jgi:hypothetical protein
MKLEGNEWKERKEGEKEDKERELMIVGVISCHLA